jgi:hypothetical protein
MFFAVEEAPEELIHGGGLITAGAVIDAQMEGHDSRIAGTVVGCWYLVVGCVGRGTMLKEAAMTITLDLPPETEANLVAQAKARGLSLDAFLKTIITTHAAVVEAAKLVEDSPRAQRDLDSVIDELFDAVQLPPGIGEGAMRRENWYR